MNRLLALCAWCLLAGAAAAAEVQVAVAANFSEPALQIAAEFERRTGHRALLAFGATGKFHAQITHGAPFGVLLAADETTPARLEQEGLGVPGSRFTYAVGRLVLWSARPERVDARGDILQHGHFERLAIANPRTAPYGRAAIEVLTRLKLLETVQSRIVQGENIAQTHQFVSTGNAELGFVAWSQVFRDGRLTGGSAWPVPETLHAPIRQDALILARGRDNPAATAFAEFLRTPAAQAVIQAYGYALR